MLRKKKSHSFHYKEVNKSIYQKDKYKCNVTVTRINARSCNKTMLAK